MDKKVEIGNRIKELLVKKFGSVAACARLVEKDKTHFSKYIKGQSYLGGEMLAKLAELGVDINYLLTGERAVDEEVQNVLKDLQEQIKHLNEEHRKDNNELKADLFDLSKTLKQRENEIIEKDKKIQQLLYETGKLIELNKKYHKQINDRW